MSTFKTALRIASRHIAYIVTYLLLISFIGVLIVLSMQTSTTGTHVAYEPTIAVVDKDGSDLSQALEDHLASSEKVVDVGEDDFALQDALVQEDIDCVIVIPEGFGADFEDAVAAGGKLPEVQIAYGTYVNAGVVASADIEGWLRLVGSSLKLEPQSGLANAVDRANDAIGEKVETSQVKVEGSTDVTNNFGIYLAFSTYTIFASVSVLSGIIFNVFSLSELRRRRLASPLPNASASLQLLAAGTIIAIVAWAWTCGLGLITCTGLLDEVSLGQVALCLVAMLAFALVPLAVGFLLSQTRLGEQGINAVANIGGMVVSFLGGAWVSLDLVGPEVRAVAPFSPSYWATDALDSALASTADMGRIAGDIGIVLVFALVIAIAGVALGRARMQSSAA